MMPLYKPNPIKCEIWTCEFFKIHKDKRYEDGVIEVHQKGGWTFAGMKVKDLFRTEKWHKILPKLKPLYLAVHGLGCTPLVIEAWYKRGWHTIWSRGNNFDTFAEDKKSTKDYENFTINEGKKVARLIDEGRSFKYIKSKLSKEHSGNTYGCAMHYGICKAKNKENSEKVKAEHNKDCGGTGKEKGTINPAILTIGVKPKK